jgi:hypothetical protein
MVLLLKVVGHPFFEVPGFAYINDIAPFFGAIPEEVAAGKMRKRI